VGQKDFSMDTAAASGLTVQQWDSSFYTEYFQDRFKELKGSGENSIIQVKEDLAKKDGDSVTFALVNRLTNAAVTGVSTLEGNEEDMLSRSHRVYVDKRRNAVRVPEMAEQRSAISLRNAAKPVLLDWAQEDTRDLYIDALGSINGVDFVDATGAQRNAWLVDNADRVVFGAGVGSFTDHSADLALLDSSNDIFKNTNLDLMIMKAKTCSPRIRPMRDAGNGKRYFVALANPYAFADLRASIDTEVLALTNVEMQASKLFEGGDLMWNGVIVKECDNIPIYTNLGDSATTEVTPVYLLGAQALGHAVCKRWRTITEVFDYNDKHGVAVDTIMGIEKLIFGTHSTVDTSDTKDHGVVTGYFATTGAGTVSGAEPS
jgi:N4-gp56 family major capsid protein